MKIYYNIERKLFEIKKIHAKLCNQSGESIGETLVALLISALALVMLAGAIGSAAKVITRSNEKMTKYYQTDNKIAERATAKSGPINITMTEKTDSTLTQTTVTGTYKYYMNDEFGNTLVVGYAK